MKHMGENKNVQNMVLKRVNKTSLPLFEGNLFRDGKRHSAARVVLRLLAVLKRQHRRPVMGFLGLAIANSYPYVTLRSKKVGGSVYQIPIHLIESKQNKIAVKWLTSSCGLKLGTRRFCLRKELISSISHEGVAAQKKKALHALAVGNRAYIKYL
jgi:small subunit ribosomal protein S7